MKNLVLVFVMLLGSIFAFGQTPDTVEWRDGVWHVNKAPSDITEYDLSRGPLRAYDYNADKHYLRKKTGEWSEHIGSITVDFTKEHILNNAGIGYLEDTVVLIRDISLVEEVDGLFVKKSNGLIEYYGNNAWCACNKKRNIE